MKGVHRELVLHSWKRGSLTEPILPPQIGRQSGEEGHFYELVHIRSSGYSLGKALTTKRSSSLTRLWPSLGPSNPVPDSVNLIFLIS